MPASIDALDLLADLVARARTAGADAADAMLVESAGLSATRRLGKLEKVERAEGLDLGLRVFIGRRQAIVTSIESKARIVSGDVEDRSGKRALLNLGHSFGHAIEAENGLGNVLHGEAVALGLSLAFRFSTELGLCPKSDADRVTGHFAACGLPTRLSEVGIADAR